MKLFLKILLIITWIALVAGAVVLMSFANKSHSLQRCSGITVNIDYHHGEPLITPDIIKSQLQKEFGKFDNKLLGDISVEQVNSFLRKNQYLEKSDVHLSVEGQLVADVRQNNPILRVITIDGRSYYIDGKGRIMQADPKFPVRVVIASGFIGLENQPQGKNIKSFFDGKKKIAPELLNLDKAFKVSLALADDSIMKALTEQIYIPTDGKVAILTKTGTHTVVLGNATDLEEKFSKLLTFYKYGLPKVGWEKYRSINLAFKNQVICSK
jgi:cell division protein FtsQ